MKITTETNTYRKKPRAERKGGESVNKSEERRQKQKRNRKESEREKKNENETKEQCK